MIDSSVPDAAIVERPLAFDRPLTHYLSCATLLERLQMQGPSQEIRAQAARALRSPFSTHYPPSAALCSLLAHHLQMQTQPLLVSNELFGVPLAAKVADHWLELARLKEDPDLLEAGTNLKKWTAQLGINAKWLFCRENELLEHFLPTGAERFVDEKLAISGVAGERLSAYFTLSGCKTGLGALRLDDVEVRAFGPQTPPLSETELFGINRKEARGAECASSGHAAFLRGWTRSFGDPEAWVFLEAKTNERGAEIFVRLETERPLMMAFYVRAKRCELFDGTLVPLRSLLKIRAPSQKILFNKSVSLESSEPLYMHIIPLAGTCGFWNTTFLIAFEMNSTLNRAIYSLQLQ